MKKQNIKNILIIVLVLIEFITVFLSVKSFSNKPVENTKEENKIKRKQFSMYVENDNGEYDEYNSSNMFPTGYVLNTDKSTCVDNTGQEVKGVLSGNGNKVTITSNKTVFCYVYFDKDNSAANFLIDNVSSDILWKSTLEDDGYRYVGTDVNNYICFGTSDKETCTEGISKYMYQIIGIFEDNFGIKHLKLVKYRALSGLYVWNDDSSTAVDWNESDLYKALNGIAGGVYSESNYFVNGKKFDYMEENSNWYNKIATWNYTMTNTLSWENYGITSAVGKGVYGPSYYYMVGSSIYLHELNRNDKSSSICYYSSNKLADCDVGEWQYFNGKISLPYASDYILALGLKDSSFSDFQAGDIIPSANEGWLSVNDYESSDVRFQKSEWTMTRSGRMESGGAFCAVDMYNSLDIDGVGNSGIARPVFYLESDVKFSTSTGDGSITNPYIIEE